MELSGEQKKVIHTVKKEDCKLLKISARSGTGKTTMLTEITKAIEPKNGLYLAYNKAIADEAKEKFGSNISCSTTHSLAYKYTVRKNKLKVNPFTFKDIKERVRYDTKLLIIEVINAFSLSKYIRFDDFISNNKELAEKMNSVNKKILILAKEYIGKMFKGEVDITHAVYLKMFHILLANNKIQLEEQDIIMLDECVAGSSIIDTEKGLIAIEWLYAMYQNGSVLPRVKSYNEKEKKIEYKEIGAIIKHKNRDTIKITTSRGTLITTQNHKLYGIDYNTENEEVMFEWLESKNLNNKTVLSTPHKDKDREGEIGNKRLTFLTQYIKSVEPNREIDVFDLQVVDNNNYFINIGHEYNEVLSHNCGDLNPVTLEIFKLLKANKKIMVGDISQTIYSFNGTINGFEEMKNEGVLLELTQSFRCSKDIAKRVEKFMQVHYDENFKFSGVEPNKEQEKTVAYISRTNSSMIGSMIELMKTGEKFNLARQPQSIFELILILLYLKPGGEIRQKQWKHLQEDVDLWNIDESLQNDYETYMSYIASKYNDDIDLKSALTIIGTYSREEIFKAYAYSKQCKEDKTKHKITLTTSHSSKGLEFYKVYIHDDLNKTIEKILEKEHDNRTETELEEIRLYYVACTRASHVLINAKMLDYKINKKDNRWI